jgi:DNA-directed RNA polymerase specialized sigma24 family protein
MKRFVPAPHYGLEGGVQDIAAQGLAVGTLAQAADASVRNPPAGTRGMDSSLSKIRLQTFQAIVMQALQLRRTYREVFILCEIKGYTAAEAAEILGISAAAAERRLQQARRQMTR